MKQYFSTLIEGARGRFLCFFLHHLWLDEADPVLSFILLGKQQNRPPASFEFTVF
ncbi:hypothetical protein [Rossellomorea sp. SC111]|uniref:hypothetical protein n=1 Tax=Rossellomorea sp. SC111 TaxID=2968985 RepID=UPI00215B309D|nr:hypothetical protein [Rossellomorea sp. SC111]